MTVNDLIFELNKLPQKARVLASPGVIEVSWLEESDRNNPQKCLTTIKVNEYQR